MVLGAIYLVLIVVIVGGLIVNSVHQTADLVQSDIISGHFTPIPKNFSPMPAAVIDNGYRQIDQVLLPKMNVLINARVQHVKNQLYISLGIAFLLLLAAHYFLAGIYYALVGNIQSFAGSVRAFAGDDWPERINPGTRDELCRIGDSFNEMDDGFNALLKARLEDQAIKTKLRAIIDASPVPMLLNDDQDNITFLNPAFIQIFGYTLEEIPTLADWWAKASPDPEWMAVTWQTLLHVDSQCNPVELDVRCHSGATKTVLANASVIEQSLGRIQLVALYDITWRKQAEADLRTAAIAFETQEAMIIADANQVILNVNQAFTRITGYSAEEAIGQTPALLKSGYQDAQFYQNMWESLARDGYWKSEIWNRRKCGDVYPERITITAVTDAEGGVVNYIATFDDISQYKQVEETIHDLVFYDSLTKLPNRRLLMERLKHSIEVERRDGKQLALMMLDLDRFKVINNSLGYLAGDELLQQVATRIATRLRKVDLVARLRKVDLLARLGGDEFIMLLEDIAHTEDAARVAEEVIGILNNPFHLSQGDEICITASIGISLYPQHGDNPQTLISYADAALHKAKAEGRGCFAYYSRDLTLAARELIALEARLRKAIEQQELRVFYQPQVDIVTGRIIGAEALVRWLDPIEGLIAPAHFIPLAEETGLILEIGAWVLRETCRQGKQWLNEGLPPLTLAVNVSAHQFRRSDISALVTTVLSETGFPAERLELEMTESGLMESQAKVMDLLNNLRALGVRFAIDDFGTGYSSLAYLKHFPLDSLKIDKSFIDDIPHLQDDMAIAATIIAMGHMLGFKVLAEGVETVEQLAFLQDKGCDAYQGYLKSKPVPADEFVELLRVQ